jgi:hypothetical protein
VKVPKMAVQRSIRSRSDELSMRSSSSKEATESLIAAFEERADVIFRWLLRDIEPDYAYPQYRGLLFTICLTERLRGTILAGYSEKSECHPLYMTSSGAVAEYDRLSKNFPVLWWEVLAHICKSHDISELSCILESMEPEYRSSIIVKILYMLSVVGFLNNFA